MVLIWKNGKYVSFNNFHLGKLSIQMHLIFKHLTDFSNAIHPSKVVKFLFVD